MIKTRWGLGLTGAVVLGVVGIFGGHVPFGLAGVVFIQPDCPGCSPSDLSSPRLSP